MNKELKMGEVIKFYNVTARKPTTFRWWDEWH